VWPAQWATRPEVERVRSLRENWTLWLTPSDVNATYDDVDVKTSGIDLPPVICESHL